jgi:hypothetical protein
MVRLIKPGRGVLDMMKPTVSKDAIGLGDSIVEAAENARKQFYADIPRPIGTVDYYVHFDLNIYDKRNRP